MVSTSNVLLELPKRAAVLVDDRAHRGTRAKARGLFWLTLTTVVLSFVVVLASLWKTCAPPSVPAQSSPVAVTSPDPASPRVLAPLPPPEAPVATDAVELPADPASPVPTGFPSLNQFP